VKQPEVWSQIAQGLIATGSRPHFAPDAGILDILRQEVGRFVAARRGITHALVLGATPELADLALAAGCEVVRVDCNPAMFEAARKRQTVADRRRERCIVGDWLELDGIGEASIDLVLGDSALNNVPDADMAAVLAQLAHVIRPGGLLALRQIALPDAPVPAWEAPAAVAAFRAGRLTPDEFHRALRFYAFAGEAVGPDEHVLDATRVFAAIDRARADGLLSAAEHDFLAGRRSAVRHTVYRLAHQRRALESLGACEVLDPAPAASPLNLFRVFLVRVGAPTAGGRDVA